MSNETAVVKIDAKQYGLEETKAREIEAVFIPMINKMKELESEFNEVVVKPISKELCAEAKELRLKYVKVRTGTAKIHTEAKAFYLAGGRFVDGWKNAQLYASEGIEKRLKGIEDHYENLEKERIQKLKEEREAILIGYVGDLTGFSLGVMSEDAWQNLLASSRHNRELRIAAEEKAELDRIEAEQAKQKELDAQRAENGRLRKEALERERVVAEERRAVQAKIKADEDAYVKMMEEEQAKSDAIMKAEREKQAKEQAVLKAKADEDRKAREVAEAEQRALQEKMARMITCPKCMHRFENVK